MTDRPQQMANGSEFTASALDRSPEPESPPSAVITHVLDHGHVYLEQFVGGDLSVVNSARVSYAQRHEEIEEGDPGLINFLLKHKHGTPFEHNLFTFNVRLPLFVAREWIRHRIGSFNEVSMRYTKIDPEFYIPNSEDVRVRVGKPGAYTYETAPGMDAKFFRQRLGDYSDAAKVAYETALEDGIAPELARLFLPVNVYTQWYWTVNARSLMNFLTLRCAPQAQYEIRVYAEAILDIFEIMMPYTYQAYINNGMEAP